MDFEHSFCSSGVGCSTAFFIRRCSIHRRTTSKEQADHVLEVLANLYAMSEIQFVAVPLKTALSYAKSSDQKKAKLIYEGSEHVFAEVNDLSLQRIFPDFEALIQEEGTLELWSKVFEPFWAWLDLQDTPETYSKHVELVEG
jgi:exonuclease V gamma subunit